MESKTILIIEDSKRLREYMSSKLEKFHYTILQAGSGAEAYEILKKECFDLVLLDLNLGDIDGLEILKTIRRQNETLPVIIVSSIANNDTKITGFNIGCDDYITKPFYVDELISRIQRMLKRAEKGTTDKNPVIETISQRPFEINLVSMTLSKNGKAIPVRKKLFDLMLFFMKNPNVVLTSEKLFEEAWHDAFNVNENSLYVHMRQLRSLVEENPTKPKFIQTVRNAGYMFVPEQTSNSTR